MLEIRWRLRINDAQTSSNFWQGSYRISANMNTPPANLQPHENSFGELAKCIEIPPRALNQFSNLFLSKCLSLSCVWYCHNYVIQMTKTLKSTLIRYRSDTFASDQCLISVDQRVFAIWEIIIQQRNSAEPKVTSVHGTFKSVFILLQQHHWVCNYIDFTLQQRR